MKSRSRRMILHSSTSSLGLHLVDCNEPAIYDMAYLTVNLSPLSGREKGDVHITVAGTFNTKRPDAE
ncbi:hypothetical protein L1887_03970 [Cichorium endivia]|nr:hypothetical protein L1887_03970 [Cichorium endivia]